MLDTIHGCHAWLPSSGRKKRWLVILSLIDSGVGATPKEPRESRWMDDDVQPCLPGALAVDQEEVCRVVGYVVGRTAAI